MGLIGNRDLGYESSMFREISRTFSGDCLYTVMGDIASDYTNFPKESIFRSIIKIEDYAEEILISYGIMSDLLSAFQHAMDLYNYDVLNKNIGLIREGIAKNYIKQEGLDITVDEIRHLIADFEKHDNIDTFVNEIFLYATGEDR